LTVLPFRKPEPHILIVEDDDTTLEVFLEFVQMAITPQFGRRLQRLGGRRLS
jgi:hypothetical protein